MGRSSSAILRRARSRRCRRRCSPNSSAGRRQPKVVAPELCLLLTQSRTGCGLSAASIAAGDATRPPRAVLSCAVAFLDPPYGSGRAAPALSALAAGGWLTPDALVVIEVAAREDLPLSAGFTLMDERVYGAARLVFLRRERDSTGDQR